MRIIKIALGMITRNLDTDEDIMRFVKNADKYGHKLECVIVAYTHRLDPLSVGRISKKLPFFAVSVNDPAFCKDEFRRRGISGASEKTLLECPVDTGRGLVPYGHNRNLVLIEAILREIDILFFVDSDVIPETLKETPRGRVLEEGDFFGAHLEHLNAGSQITTSEYSGYNILPCASFDGMDDLLAGLQKSDKLEYWKSSETHRCLAFQPPERMIAPCAKILGGNVALTLSAFKKLPPFFSSYYYAGGELFLCRGEDTLMGYTVEQSGIVCTDIGYNPMHDTYKNYPAEPDLKNDTAIQERFYFACTGWVGRNPFMNYIHGVDLEATRAELSKRLERGLRALAAYTSNPRYYSVIKNYNISWDSLGRYISEYEQVLEAWEEFRQLTV